MVRPDNVENQWRRQPPRTIYPQERIQDRGTTCQPKALILTISSVHRRSFVLLRWYIGKVLPIERVCTERGLYIAGFNLASQSSHGVVDKLYKIIQGKVVLWASFIVRRVGWWKVWRRVEQAWRPWLWVDRTTSEEGREAMKTAPNERWTAGTYSLS